VRAQTRTWSTAPGSTAFGFCHFHLCKVWTSIVGERPLSTAQSQPLLSRCTPEFYEFTTSSDCCGHHQGEIHHIGRLVRKSQPSIASGRRLNCFQIVFVE
jgi:hypothetical protein